MIGRQIRRFGLFFGGSVLITGGGFGIVFGLLLLAFAAPGGPDPMAIVDRLLALIVPVVTSEGFLVLAVVGTVGYVWEVYRNGLWPTDDRMRYQRQRDLRREWAEEREEWDPPGEDAEDETVYEHLRAEMNDGLVLRGSTLERDGQPSVRGVVANDAYDRQEDVRVRVVFRDENGERVDSGIATTREIPAGETWEFEVFSRAGDVATYAVSSPRTADS